MPDLGPDFAGNLAKSALPAIWSMVDGPAEAAGGGNRPVRAAVPVVSMVKLDAYRAKRDFRKTAEPSGGGEESAGSAFVIQKHDATRLHYDLRLELDGVMKSWAVAKGPSLVVGEKRLAIHVEDHPVAYNAFEGTIPKGQYGGGTVMIWDRGRWTPEGDPHRGYAKGHLNFSLEGEKMHGAWHLVRMKKKPGEKQEPWLLIKAEDAWGRGPEDADLLDEKPLSVATGRTLDAIASAADGAVWDSSRGLAAEERAAKPGDRKRAATIERPSRTTPSPSRGRRPERSGGPDGGPAEGTPTLDPARPPPPAPPREGNGTARAVRTNAAVPMPRAVEPCLAKLVASVPAGDRWLHEIKWDGYRLVGFRRTARSKPSTRLATRNGHDWTSRFPRIAAAFDTLPVDTAIIDGEAVIEDEHGVSSFSALQAALSDVGRGVARDAVFHAFDLLYLDGEDLRALPLDERKARLSFLMGKVAGGDLRLSEHVEGDGDAMVRSACSLGLEGIISKRRDRPYRSGRGDDWLKVKCTDRQEFVIGGLVPSAAARHAVGSLALGVHEGDRLVYAGRCGTGFTADSARALAKRLRAIEARRAPFAGKLTADERRGAVWVEPTLVAEVEFRGWTDDGRIRHAAFKGLREDKTAAEVVREEAAGAGKPSPAEPARGHARKAGAGGDTVAGVKLTHPERVLWADAGVTKLDLARFYESIAAWILPQIVGRPLSLVRCPAGAEGQCFFQKHSWAGLSDHIRRETVRDEGGEEEVLFVEDLAGLVALVQSGVLEIHPWGSRIDDVARADRVTMDLDPGEGVAWIDVIDAAREVRQRLSADDLDSFVKTTGGKGLHVVVPLDGGRDWAAVKRYAKSLADAMERDAPDRYVAKSTKAARRGRIYVDYLRNGRGATAVAAYSTRARPGATCSVPLDWSELTPSSAPDRDTVLNLAERLKRRKGDPWAEIGRLRQPLP